MVFLDPMDLQGQTDLVVLVPPAPLVPLALRVLVALQEVQAETLAALIV
jgi:hypothetical protein